MRLRPFALVLVWALAAGTLGEGLRPRPALAQVYHWVDDQGTVHYSTGLESVPERYRDQVRLLPGSPPSVSSGVTRITFAPGSPILVSARINGGGPVTLILDTGAERTLVAPSALIRLGVPTAGAGRGELTGVTGTSPVAVVWLTSLEVGQARAGPLPVIAHDASLGPAEGLLGRDFLDLFKVTIDSRAGVVTLAPH